MPGFYERSLRIAVRLAVFAALSFVALKLFATLLYALSGNLLLTSALAVFLAAGLANAILMRIYEQARLTQLGLAWTQAGRRNLLLGLAGGAGAAGLMLGGALASQAAEFQAVPGGETGAGALLFVAVLLLFGAVGEEMLFRGYGFQVLLAALGPFAILPVGALFALAHSDNLHITLLGALNTFGWGILLGYAFWRSGDLWLPIGLHLGWNWTLPLAGVPLSGFTMNVTGYAVRWSAGALWSGGDYGPEGGILTSGMLVILFVALRVAPVRRQSAFLLRARQEG